MGTSDSRFVVCYALGVGAGFDYQLGGYGRQLSEDFAEILALHEQFTTLAQMVVVREQNELAYTVSKNACAFAVFYSLPETEWILESTRAIGGDIALTGRIMDDESGLILSINMIDVHARSLLFCGCETCARDAIHEALVRLGARILGAFTNKKASYWLEDVQAMVGTTRFHAYANWMNAREIERRALREGVSIPNARLAEHLAYALVADPAYERASLKLCDVMAEQLPRQTYEFILRNLESQALNSEVLALIVVQCFARLGKRPQAESILGDVLAKWPNNGLFYLMRGCVTTDAHQASRDLSDAKVLLGNEFNGCRTAVDNALVNVAGI